MGQNQSTANIPMDEATFVENHRVTPASPPPFVMQLFAKIGSFIAMTWAMLALGASALQTSAIPYDVVPQFLAMNPTTALGFFLSGASVLLYAYSNHARSRRTAAQIGGGLIAIWGLICLSANQRFFSSMFEFGEGLATQSSTPFVPIACVILTSLGVAILTLPSRSSVGHGLSQYFAVAPLLMGGIATTGYLYRVPLMYEYDSTTYGLIDTSTALLAVILGLALLCAHPTEGLMKTLMSPDIGGTLLRRLLPFAIGLPILVGWLQILGQRQEWYGFDFGVAIVVGGVLLILLTCLWYVAGWADRVDRERRRILKACTDQEVRLHFAATAARIGYWHWTGPTDSIEIDRVSAELLGTSFKATTTMASLHDAISVEDRIVFEQVIEKARRNLCSFEIECRPAAKTGVRWISLSGFPSAHPRMSSHWFHGVMVDITERKLAEQTLKRWDEELESQVSERTAALSRSQERLRALIVQLTRTEHQERRHIAGELHDHLAQLLIAAHLKLIQDRRPFETDQDHVLVKELERILDQALSCTRSLGAKLSPPVLYYLGLPAALQWLAEQMKEHQLIVETAFDVPTDPPKLPDDVAAILFKSVRELLSNVVKHAGSPHVRIALRTTADRNLVIVVTDQGHGFDASQLDQASPSTTSFGLFCIKEHMEALGGSIHVHSRLGRGTSVTLVCPITTLKRNGPQDGALTSPNSGRSRSLRILLVDDHAMVRHGIRALLERHDDLLVVGEAWDGQHACELADSLHPDVVVMDANMPRLDGIKATRLIKNEHPQIVIIGLSVQSAAQVANSMLQAGASRYLTKESAGDQLYETIKAAVA
jgi:signal transduction histidine kinase